MRRMSPLWLTLLVLGWLPLDAGASELKVSISHCVDKVEILFSTQSAHPFICHLRNNRVEVEAPCHKSRDGKIMIEAAVDPRQVCLGSPGPHSGNLQLKRGYTLPELPNGSYELRINGERYGTLVADENTVALKDNRCSSARVSGLGKLNPQGVSQASSSAYSRTSNRDWGYIVIPFPRGKTAGPAGS